ncbi:MAG TPA: DinB family protein [Fulvivirga sp.]|nr:DinB family protein [Fulvivirga sp.]
MNSKIKIQFDKLEVLKTKLLDQLTKFNDDQINFKPAPDQWSLGQVMFHLHLVEQRVFEYISNKSQDTASLNETGLKESWRMFLLHLFLKFPIKFKAPKVVADAMPDSINMEQLRIDWQSHREQMKELLNNQDEKHLHLKIFKHPRIGYINMFQTMSFINAHHRHHLKQINGLLSKIKMLNN